MDIEIERKWLVSPASVPYSLEAFESSSIEQYYLCTDPVIRIRKRNDSYTLTCKGSGSLSRTECNIPITEEAFDKLKCKAEGVPIIKDRYLIPLEDDGLNAELDVFHGRYEGLVFVEVEFENEASATSFQAPEWFGTEVTYVSGYSNAELSSNWN